MMIAITLMAIASRVTPVVARIVAPSRIRGHEIASSRAVYDCEALTRVPSYSRRTEAGNQGRKSNPRTENFPGTNWGQSCVVWGGRGLPPTTDHPMKMGLIV